MAIADVLTHDARFSGSGISGEGRQGNCVPRRRRATTSVGDHKTSDRLSPETPDPARPRFGFHCHIPSAERCEVPYGGRGPLVPAPFRQRFASAARATVGPTNSGDILRGPMYILR